jgi:hypothetical protein
MKTLILGLMLSIAAISASIVFAQRASAGGEIYSGSPIRSP